MSSLKYIILGCLLKASIRRCHEQLAEMVHTKDGSRVVREFIAQGTAKVSYTAIKSLKFILLSFFATGPKTDSEGA